jgi:hypothetical protein
MESSDIISKTLGIEFDGAPPTPITKPTSTAGVSLDADFNYVRDNIKGLIDNGSCAIDEILKVAKAGDSPRAYEVLGQLLKTVSEMNKDLIDLYQKTKQVKKEEIKVNNTTNNSIYVGSTSELQDLINQDRSRRKALDSQHFLDGNNGV